MAVRKYDIEFLLNICKRYVTEESSTLISLAKEYGIKSHMTIYDFMRYRLISHDVELYKQTRHKIAYNSKEKITRSINTRKDIYLETKFDNDTDKYSSTFMNALIDYAYNKITITNVIKKHNISSYNKFRSYIDRELSTLNPYIRELVLRKLKHSRAGSSNNNPRLCLSSDMMLKNKIAACKYYIENDKTLTESANKYHISVSTISNFVRSGNLKEIDTNLYEKVVNKINRNIHKSKNKTSKEKISTILEACRTYVSSQNMSMRKASLSHNLRHNAVCCFINSGELKNIDTCLYLKAVEKKKLSKRGRKRNEM